MALGAQRGTIHRLVLGEGLRAAAIGLSAGVVVTLGSGRMMQGLLYDVRPADPMVLAAVAVILGCVVAAASPVPARRATAVVPARSLRQG
jgi:putative ABC transport system permease protein